MLVPLFQIIKMRLRSKVMTSPTNVMERLALLPCCILTMFYQPISVLYGPFTILVLITVIKSLPFTSRTGIAAMLQIHQSLEETARVQGIGWFRRMFRIILPLSMSGLVAGMLVLIIITISVIVRFLSRSAGVGRLNAT